ncbi:hypothetical protein MED297_04417 [Reinekea sp. MED297]|uniref:Uncharacterized protein n=1 Tax=Reinekea blandensis MED297 TaxID=314283 RepID=A4BG88_9GAMM|nr:hypothetical protein MED297_04417 [Reinekea sp. MED297] [Reinekea blandensis MED297]
MVIQPGTTQRFFIHGKPERFNQVQLTTGVGAQADNIAGIRWNFRFKQHNMKHVWRLCRKINRGIIDQLLRILTHPTNERPDYTLTTFQHDQVRLNT